MAFKSKLAVFDASNVVMTWGAITIDGLADGTFVEIEQLEDSFTDKSGADGEVVRSKTQDRRFNINFTLLQSSQANALLSVQHNIDINSANGDGVAALRVFDPSSGTVFNAPTAWIVKPSNIAYGKEDVDREWSMRAASGEMQHGFNPAV